MPKLFAFSGIVWNSLYFNHNLGRECFTRLFDTKMKLITLNQNLKNKPDEELLGLFLQKGDTAFLGELYQRYIHLVFGLCMKYLKDPHVAKDAVLNVYEKVQTDAHRHDIKNFKNWLYVVSKNHCLMELRKSKPGKVFSLSDKEQAASLMEFEVEMHPIDREQNEEITKALEDCIKKLKAEQQKSIRLFYYSNKCYREIAELMETEEKKVKSFIQNAKRNLKICLEKSK